MKVFKIIIVSAIVVFVFLLNACSADLSGAAKGKDLSGNDAMNFLAGDTEKKWKLTDGDDFFKLMCFDKSGNFVDQTGYKATFVLDGDQLTINDYENLTYTIKDIDQKTMTLKSPDGILLIYDVTTQEPGKSGSSSNKKVETKWIKGADHGSVWKGSPQEYTYTFMNDGRFFDSNTGSREERWQWIGSDKIMISNGEFPIKKLSATTMVLEMYGEEVTLNYAGEADNEGKLMEKNQ